MSLNTRLIHEGKIEDDAYNSVVTPIYQSTTFYAQEYKDVRYPCFNNTANQIVLHSRLADVEEADTSLVTASGMAAITTAILAVLKVGDHLIAQRYLYGNTFTFFENILSRFGIEVDYVDVCNACSKASNAMSACKELDTRQPTIRRANASMTKAT